MINKTKMSSFDDLPDKLSWRTFYGIPVVHYSDKIVSRLSLRRRTRWQRALEAFKKLESAGIRVYIVPLSLDHQTGTWWMDYPGDYIAHGLGEPEYYQHPYLMVVLKIDDEGYLLYDKPIFINHSGLNTPKFIVTKTGKSKSRKLNPHYEAGMARKQAVMDSLGKYSWFAWDGSIKHSMKIAL